MAIIFSEPYPYKEATDEVKKKIDKGHYDDEIKRVLRIQENKLKNNPKDTTDEGLTYFEWLNECIRHLQTLWIGCSYWDAKNNIEGMMEMAYMKFPDPDYEWTLQSARDFAVEVSYDGECYGSNQ
jgi:hypothetical protein